MSSTDKVSEILPKEEETQLDINALIPIGLEFLKNNQKQHEDKVSLKKAEIQSNSERLQVEKSAFTHKYWLLVFIAISVIAIASALIFYKNDTTSGLSMLSHVGAVVVGIIAGSGWERIRSK